MSAGSAGSSSASFSDVLEQARRRADGQAGSVTLSNHANSRLQERGIVASPRMMEQISRATDLLAAKRSRESLVVVGQVGFVVNVPSRVVVTAMPLGESEPQVFTNIDSAVWWTKEQGGLDR
jgi:flagellar operon protein